MHLQRKNFFPISILQSLKWSISYRILYLYLLHSEVQEGVLIADADQTLGAFTSHAGAQASVQLHHHQFVQTMCHIVRQASSGNLIVGLDLTEREKGDRRVREQQVNL